MPVKTMRDGPSSQTRASFINAFVPGLKNDEKYCYDAILIAKYGKRTASASTLPFHRADNL